MIRRNLIVFASLFALLAVVFAAVGSHVLPPDAPGVGRRWDIANQLHLFHALAVFAIAVLAEVRNSLWIERWGWTIFIGAALFSGTIYVRALGWDALPGMLTPIGGAVAMVGWAGLTVSLAIKKAI